MPRPLLVGFVLLFLPGAGCKFTEGSGVLSRETRSVAPFNEIETSGSFNVQITVGDRKPLVLAGDDNLLPLVRTVVEGQRLKVSIEGGAVRPRNGLSLSVSTPRLSRIACSGAADVTATGIDEGSFRLEVSGAGAVDLQGRTRQLDVSISGAAKIAARQLVAQRVAVHASGASQVTVHAAESLRVKLSGAGSVSYHGNPKDVVQDISGVGKVERL